MNIIIIIIYLAVSVGFYVQICIVVNCIQLTVDNSSFLAIQTNDCWQKNILLRWPVCVEQSACISQRRNAFLGLRQAFA